MKRTKIIIGAFMLVALFSANGFAQEQNGIRSLAESTSALAQSIFTGRIASLGKTLAQALVEKKAEKEQTRTFLAIAPEQYMLEETIKVNPDGYKAFAILLPKSIKNDLEKKNPLLPLTSWEDNSIKFSVLFKDFYALVTAETTTKPVEMRLAVIETKNKEGETSEALVLKYKIDDKVLYKKVARIKPAAKLCALNAGKEVKLGETFPVKDSVRIAVQLPSKGYQLEQNTKEVFNSYLKTYFNSECAFIRDNKLYITLVNDNPAVEGVSTKIVEEKGKVYCVFTVGDKTYKNLIATK